MSHPHLIKPLLLQSYHDIPVTKEDIEGFSTIDEQVAEHPEWIGKYVFFTLADGNPVGFVSFDPRKKPVAEIGHNCIIPAYRGRGLGTKQMKQAIEEIKKQGFTKVTVSTGASKYFLPAVAMYKSCGFGESSFFEKEGKQMVLLEKTL
jgi:GNAT superfamily N-acetyltransferase